MEGDVKMLRFFGTESEQKGYRDEGGGGLMEDDMEEAKNENGKGRGVYGKKGRRK